ncbi:MAG: hypothetical protein E6J70_17815 [Deltaproteobacteria bacterium]|nr:MAG: hypothetical protein E6J70_17815 [Deltaproteobacteria bacterium]
MRGFRTPSRRPRSCRRSAWGEEGSRADVGEQLLGDARRRTQVDRLDAAGESGADLHQERPTLAQPRPLGLALAQQRVEEVLVDERQPSRADVEPALRVDQHELRDAQPDGQLRRVARKARRSGDGEHAEPRAPRGQPERSAQRLGRGGTGGVEVDDRDRQPPVLARPGQRAAATQRGQEPALGSGPPQEHARVVADEVRDGAGERAEVGARHRGRERQQHAPAAKLLEVEILLVEGLGRR